MAEIIERYLDDANVGRLERDFKFLIMTVASSYGELELAFREGRVSVYYRGNSLPVIVFRPADKYRIDIHKRFLDGLDPETREEFTLTGSYGQVTADARGAHRILQRRNVGRLMKAIRDVNHSEELTFEQILIADNPPSREFLLIDRQVTDHHMHRRLDLLGLRRLESGRYGFVVIEVKRASPRPRQRSSDSSSPLCREPAAATVRLAPPFSTMSSPTYKSLNALMRHMRSSAGIDVRGSAHKRALAHMGYFHGYKGYRFSGSPSRRIPYAGFDDLSAVVSFDSGLKALFYPLLMKLEMTMKNLALVELLEAADTSVLTGVYGRLMPGTKKNGRQGKLEVIHAGNQVLLERHRRGDRIVTHYYDAPGEVVPLWALFEVITLGHFGRLLEQLSPDALVRTADIWGVRRSDADLVPHLVFAITDLRNAVAHNGVVFDTRFASARIRKKVAGLLGRETGFEPELRVSFDTITDYLALVVYLSAGLGFPKREVYRAITSYAALTDDLRSRVPARVFDLIVHTDNRAKVRRLEAWVRAT